MDVTRDARWRAMLREAQLAAEEAAYGVTMLGRANHARIGLYTQAFFGLSVGLERMGKLIFLANHAVMCDGALPTDKDLRRIGHNLASLMAKCEMIGDGFSEDRVYRARPCDAIHGAIVEVLSLFAMKLRYYNLNHMVGSAQQQQDPVELWWEKVATPICDRHYSQRQREKDEAESMFFERVYGDSSAVLHSTETGEPIQDLYSFIARSGATRVVQKYGRVYTMQIIRWLASMISYLSHVGAYEKRIPFLFGLDEPFVIYRNEDSYFRNRTKWSIY